MRWGSKLRGSKRRAWPRERGRRERRRCARFAPLVEGLERICLLTYPYPTTPQTFVVNSADEVPQPRDEDSVPGMMTLDDAFIAVLEHGEDNEDQGVPPAHDTITFAIVPGETFSYGGVTVYTNPMSGPFVLTPYSPSGLGETGDGAPFPVTIDATTQANYAPGKPQVYIDGTNTDVGLVLGGGGSTISGLGFINYDEGALTLEGGAGDVVTGCVFGIGPTGMPAGNSYDIVVLARFKNG
jgi:hypothetical protein